MLGYADIIREEAENNPELTRYADNIIISIKRASDLTNQLLAFARKGKYLMVPVDVHRVVFEVVNMLKHTFDKRIRVAQHLQASPSTTTGDPTQLQNAVLNLALNARDAMPTGGSLTIGTDVVDLEQDSDAEAGFLRMQLTSAVDGTLYELQNTTFVIEGGAETIVLSGDGTDTLEYELQAGGYSIELQDGWQILKESDTGEMELIEAELTSSNPVAFTIEADTNTEVTFTFKTDGGTVEFGTGWLLINMDIEEEEELELFSFFVTSYDSLQELSGSPDGFGGDLRFGHTGQGAGLNGADSICETIAEMSMPGSSAKQWRAFLSVAVGPYGTPVNARDRIGTGPWYDRVGRLVAPTLDDLLNERPLNGDAVMYHY